METGTRARGIGMVVAAVTAVLGFVSPAQASSVTTQYYTLAPARPPSSSSTLFLGVPSGFGLPNQAPVRLSTYSPGNSYLHWTFKPYPEWPGPPVVTGSGFVDQVAALGKLLGLGTPFTPGTGPNNHSFWGITLINRATARCLTLPAPGNGTRVIVYPCSRTPNANQSWTVGVALNSVFGRRYGHVWQRKAGVARCLDVTDFRNAPGTSMQAWTCQSSPRWNQWFQLAPVARVSCTDNYVCGLIARP